MMIGYAMINPGDLTSAKALKKCPAAARVVIGCAFLPVIAEIIEVFHHRRTFVICEIRYENLDGNCDVFLVVSRRERKGNYSVKFN